MALLFFGSSLPGVVIISSASDMVENVFAKSKSQADLAALLLTLVNFLGRLIWGAASDIIGRRSFFVGSCAVQATALACMAHAVHTRSYEPWLALFLVVGSLYGGGFGVLPALLSDLFGPRLTTSTHGAMLAVWSAGALVGIPLFAYWTGELTVSPGGVAAPLAYEVNLAWVAAMPLLSLFPALALTPLESDRAARAARGGCVRVRCGCAGALDVTCGCWPLGDTPRGGSGAQGAGSAQGTGSAKGWMGSSLLVASGQRRGCSARCVSRAELQKQDREFDELGLQ